MMRRLLAHLQGSISCYGKRCSVYEHAGACEYVRVRACVIKCVLVGACFPNLFRLCYRIKT